MTSNRENQEENNKEGEGMGLLDGLFDFDDSGEVDSGEAMLSYAIFNECMNDDEDEYDEEEDEF